MYLILNLLFSLRIDLFCFQAGGRKRRPILGFKFFQFTLCYSIFMLLKLDCLCCIRYSYISMSLCFMYILVVVSPRFSFSHY